MKGERLEDKDEIMEAFVEYYEDLLTTPKGETEEEKEIEYIVKREVEGLISISEWEKKKLIEEEEAGKVIDSLKLKKSKDEQGWQNENVIYGGRVVKENLVKIFNQVIMQNKTPKQWSKMRIK